MSVTDVTVQQVDGFVLHMMQKFETHVEHVFLKGKGFSAAHLYMCKSLYHVHCACWWRDVMIGNIVNEECLSVFPLC